MLKNFDGGCPCKTAEIRSQCLITQALFNSLMEYSNRYQVTTFIPVSNVERVSKLHVSVKTE